MWDEDFTKKKFELGRVIERDSVQEIERDLRRVQLNEKNAAQYLVRGKVINTTNVDYFLNCENMASPDLGEQQVQADEEDEDDPLWNDVDVEVLKAEVKPAQPA